MEEYICIILCSFAYSIKQLPEWYIDSIRVERDKDFELSINNFVETMKSLTPDIVLVTTPNNPSGKPFTDKDICFILDNLPNESIALIDRSCINVLPEMSTREILEKYKDRKLIVLHSFSKSHSLSDERLGYLATNSVEIAKFLHYKRDLNHNINAVRKCLLALNDKFIVENKKNILRSCHKILEDYFDSNPTNGKYYKSYSNFGLIKLPATLDSESLEEKMAAKNILIMGGHRIGLDNKYIRLHMSGEDKIKSFIAEFDRICISYL